VFREGSGKLVRKQIGESKEIGQWNKLDTDNIER
jgi:hypothetical protein